MYKCDIHGKIESEWCDECQKIIDCDHSDIGFTRRKDVDFGELCITINVDYCETCDEIISIYQG